MDISSHEPITLDKPTIEELARQYAGIVAALAENMGLCQSEVMISSQAVSLAFSEAATDLIIMSIRRNPKRGISPSKIAGIVAFRLARFAPINLGGAALEKYEALKLNELAALALALKSILRVNIATVTPQYATMELQYALVRRHMNQETLGLVFEILLAKTRASYAER